MYKYLLTLLIGGFALEVSANNASTPRDSSLTTSVHELDPIVVTGNGYHEYLKTSTTPVHVLTAHDIAKQGTGTFSEALTHLMPNVEFMPDAMGSYLRLNGLGNKYVLILINGRKLTGDVSGNVDIDRIDMGQVKRIEVLNGAASSLYGSDAIGGVINIITRQPSEQLLSITTDTRISDKGKFTQNANLNLHYKGLNSLTSFRHDEADSYRNNPLEYISGNTGKTQESINPLFLGYHTNSIHEHLDYQILKNFSVYGEIGHSYKITDRPLPEEGKAGGYSYNLRYKGLRFNAGAKYKWSPLHTLQLDFVSDNYRYGYVYTADTKSFHTGDYIFKKKQQFYELELKNTNRFTANSTTIFGIDWRNDFLISTAGATDNHAYTASAYVQHDMQIMPDLRATLGIRYDKHETFGNNLTPKIALSYAPRNFNFRISYARGFRAPGLDELYYHYYNASMGGRPVVTFGNKNLNPERSHYFSLSMSYTNHKVSVTAMAFLNFINDIIVNNNIPIDNNAKTMLIKEFPDEITEATFNKMTTYGQYANSDKGIIRGINLNASYAVLTDLDFTANYAYTYARTRSAGIWETLDRSVKNSATVAVNYHHTWGRYTLNANINGRFQSKTYFIAYENAPSYGSVNINTTHSIKLSKGMMLEPGLGIDNIFNKVDNRIDWFKRQYAFLSPGRMLVVSLKLKFF